MATRTKGKKARSRRANNKQEERQLVEVHKLQKCIADDPRKALFLRLYRTPGEATFGNARASAIAAGFSREYADCITYQRPKWYSEYLGNQDAVELAETHLKEVLALQNVSQVIGAFGPLYEKRIVYEDTGEVYKSGKKKGQKKVIKKTIKVPVMKPDTAVIKVKNEAAKIMLPAYSDKYKPKAPGGPTFNFNMRAVRDEYS